MRLRYAVPVAALALVLAGCGGSDESPASSDTTPTPTSPPTSSATTPSGSPTTESSPTAEPDGGTADAPEQLEASEQLLSWQPVEVPLKDAVTRHGSWMLTVAGSGGSATLQGEDGSTRYAASGRRVSDALLDDDWAVVVLQDRTESQPSVARITELGTGKTWELDGGSDVPTVNGGTWALDDDTLVHATVANGAYCLASVDLEKQTSSVGWCAPKRHGFNAAHVTDAGTAVLSFDDSRPSCRTVVALDGASATPFPGVHDCSAWEGLVTDDGAVWSVIPQERQVEKAHFYARVGQGYYDLGPGTAGTLTWCDDAAYFVRDPQQDGAAAALMRWTADDGLSIAYQSPKGQAFLEDPRCGGDALTVTARTSSGDEQVTTDL
ncbi:hypothetical protein [Nocardioides mangrovi]|uniref:PQQ-binding-like beta-propeller repeat protein n=1 Tax=Nocardioides mangrovi TaxID=2874580 RepID=A0ABS7UA67_9ACTN|nr:hypothetical protein [Nocardioides mangrovi]MBZ5737876.1 hypothetical protein [Nocardioides mangrovi]